MFPKFKPTKKWLVYDDNPIMRKPNADLTFPLTSLDYEVIGKMISYVDASFANQAEKYDIVAGIGIAANQLGYCKKIIYIHFAEDGVEHHYLLANPKIIKTAANNLYLGNGEGCLSVLNKHEGLSIRKAFVEVAAYDLFQNEVVHIAARKLLAACLQHEVDHTNNLFYYDRINKLNPFHVDPEWEKI